MAQNYPTPAAPTATAGPAIPRWTDAGESPEPGWDEHRSDLPADLCAALRGSDAGLPELLLAAHLKVLAAVCAEPEVVTGCQPDPAGPPMVVTGPVTDGSWRELLALAGRMLAEPPAAPAGAGGVEACLDLRGLAGPVPEAEPYAGLVLWTCVTGSGDALTLRLRHRRELVRKDFAERLAGYYLTALHRLATAPGSEHHTESLVSAEELRHQLVDLSGPRVPRPAGLLVDLFEERVRDHPTAIAAIHGDRRWTYRELNERANRIAHWLLRRGLAAEDVVAVVVERNLDWLAATLGVFKAGGAYLPVRPDFPPDRVATQLDRCRCRFAVTEPGSETTLHQAIARASTQVRDGMSATTVADAYAEPDASGDPGVLIGPRQLAYIYFTSGSTGTPKGAMCEHAGMVNHLYCKLDDLRLAAGEVVTQTASQCFDISLWQLMAPLLVGGATQIIDTAEQLDVRRYVGRLGAGGIHVIQVVPAYLDVLLSHLEEHPAGLGDLRMVSVTGEALRWDLVRRWFVRCPEISLVNAYGATEVSDDTMHAVLTGPPVRGFVDVGRPLRNVNAYILDHRLRIAPLGAPGEIAFSGVSVGRGYINDPERTAQAFMDDPYRPGTRLYRTGDYGRWLPEGTIEFLGRRDEQVKLRGFRIEIGEIENRLLQVPGVAAAAVVIAGDADQTKHLVAFLVGPDSPEAADLRDLLAASLPEYMVPDYFHRLDALPSNENGKVDKRRLRELAVELSHAVAAYEPPATGTERRLATAWAEILNLPVGEVGRADDFFRLGGTSLAAVRLVVKLGGSVSLRQLTAHPVLRELATAIDAAGPDGAAGTRPGAAAPGRSPAGPVQLLATPDAEPVGSVVCFPPAAGNAVNFHALATALAANRVAVYGVEPPGHDVADPGERLASATELAELVRRQLDALAVPGPVLLWGHGAGAAPALALARLLERDGDPAAGLFVGARLLEGPDRLLTEIDRTNADRDQEITARLHREGAYVELDLLQAERAALVGRAYRHDVTAGNAYLIAAQRAGEPRLRTPLAVVVAADDPATADHRQRYADWARLAEQVTLHTVPGGGPHFFRHRPDEVATIVAARCAVPVASR